MKVRHYLLCMMIIGLRISIVTAQDSIPQEKNITQQAHEKKISLEEFTLTDQKKHKAKIFTVDEIVKFNHIHHWFIQVLDLENNFIDFANIKLRGYLKSNPEIEFNYLSPVMRLCSEGKYIIGFVNVTHPGTYVLHIEINNFDNLDYLVAEIQIPEELKFD